MEVKMGIIKPIIEEMNKKNYSLALKKFNNLTKDNPNLSFEFLLKGDIYIKLRDFDKAKNTFKEGVQKNKLPERCLLGLGIIAEKTNDYKKANQYYKESLEINETPEAYNQLGLLSMNGQGTTKDSHLALNYFDKGINIDPKYFQCVFNKGNIFLNNEDYNKALKTFLLPFMVNEENFLLTPENKEYKRFIKKISQSIEAIAHTKLTLNKVLRDIIDQILIINDLDNSTTNHISLRSIYHSISVTLNDATNELIESGITNNTLIQSQGQNDLRKMNSFLNIDDCPPKKLLKNEAFLKYINSTIILRGLKHRNTLLATETILISVRNLMLKEYESDTKNFNDEKFQPFLNILSHQCFENEYIWPINKEENKIVLKLYDNILRKYKNNKTVFNNEIFLLSSYKKLIDYPELREHLTSEKQNKTISNLIKLQIEDFIVEEKLKGKVESIKEIKNKTSLKVKSQYESYPYPRWTKENIEAYSTSFENQKSSYSVRIENDIFPNRIKSDLNLKKILIAGCGTGRQAITAAAADPNAIIMALDISKTSISYGMRQANEIGIKNIKWLHGDILDLESHKQTYDVIESSGVLHHMEDPKKGFKILSRKLRNGGFLKVGLYAKSFRDLLKPAQKIIKENNIIANLEGVRIARKNIILNHKKDNNITMPTSLADFYSTSEFIDLLLHVQSLDFTIDELVNLYNKEYNFLGFCFKNLFEKNFYEKKFPEDKKMTNIQNWKELEKQDPRLFSSMYQFWLKKY